MTYLFLLLTGKNTNFTAFEGLFRMQLINATGNISIFSIVYHTKWQPRIAHTMHKDSYFKIKKKRYILVNPRPS